MEKRFCTQCGEPLEASGKFCGACGNPVKSPAPAPESPTLAQAAPASVPPAVEASAPSVPPAESVIGAFLVSRKKNLFSVEGFHIIITSKRMIIAAYTNEMIKQAAREERKFGFLSGVLGAMTVGYSYYKRYLTMEPEKALKENPQNFAIDLGSIRKTKLEMGRRRRDPENNQETWTDSKLEIQTAGEKYSFSIIHYFHNLAADALRQAGL